MQIFYTPDIEINPELPEEEGKHAIRVLRLTEGSTALLTDGKGSFFDAIISQAHPKHCLVEITGKRQQSQLWLPHIHLAIAPTKNMDRMEWLIEKATEIGINEISFLQCRYSERKEIKLARLEKIAVSAMKRSQKATLSILNSIKTFKEFMNESRVGNLFIAHCEEREKTLLKQAIQNGENCTLLIGSEGDFSTEEITQALNKGFLPVSLGESRLRTETAALVGLQTIHVCNM
ncbi:MAG: 16S rRNA (uracil(1498)-N(3))-methyltransferase [Tannerellaceae bacterium]|nr:16S rRNA (uracil(1498)-N(3))-methyltransferase [Tannerellaceae bacterium]